jgi:hypothetical protein
MSSSVIGANVLSSVTVVNQTYVYVTFLTGCDLRNNPEVL